MDDEFGGRLAALRQSFGDFKEGGPSNPQADLGNLYLAEVENPPESVGQLFRKAFCAQIPRFPRHFVLWRRSPSGERPIGYVHFFRAGPIYLAGGLVVSPMEFRTLDQSTALLVREQGGLAEWIGRTTCSWLDGVAVFAYMGDTISIRVNSRIGFRYTGHPHLYVRWKQGVDPNMKEDLVPRLAAFGPF